MRLKALEVQGFKTFPDKTKLNFTEGITAVVGPNGSGKSNISDAIRWVLGEQSAKALRCSKMEDVVFNGTQQRKKTGYAQVTLSFDNTDRTLQFNGDEVAITRRYYRSGNSEYLINNTAVRLQDIHELFMDTGLGRDGYSMIGQGKIDSIVATKGEERREIFEEAAGISKFRYKKAEAERRLDRTEENLVRLRDIMTELEGRVEPLRVQSEKAKAYLAYAEEKKGLEIALWLKTLDKSAAAVREQEDKLAIANAQYNDAVATLEQIQQESETIFEKQNGFTMQIEELRRSISESGEAANENRSRAAVLKGDIKHNTDTAERIRNDILSFEDSGKQLISEIEEKTKEIEQLNLQLAKQNEELEKLTEELLRLRTGESNSADKIAEINASLAELTAKASDAKVKYMTSSSSINELTGRMEVVENTIKARRSQIETLENIITDYRKMGEDCKNNIEEIKSEQSENAKQTEEQKRICADLKAQADRLELSAQQLSGKARMLEDLERNLEGFAQSVKIIMREAKKGMLSGIHGPVSRVIKTPSQYSTAIEIALGAAMQNIVTENDNDAKRAIAYLKQTKGGRATFLPMSTIKGRELNESGLERCEGFVGIAAELCSCEDCYRGILLNLLGRIVVAENLDRAVEIAKKYSYRFRVVTLDGQVVNAGGSLTGGSLTKNAGLLGRASEIEKLKKQAVETKNKAKEGFDRLAEEQEKLAKLEETAKHSGQELSTAQGDLIKLEAEIRSRNTELEATEKSLQEIQGERESSVEKMNELTQAMEEARKELDTYQKAISENEETARKLTGSKDELVKERENLSERMQEIRLQILTTEKDITAAESDIENAKLRRSGADEKIRLGHEEIESINKKNEELKSEIEELEVKAEELAKSAEEKNSEIQKLNTERTGLDKRSAELRQLERDKTSEREKVSGELARLEERRANMQKQYDDITSKLWEEYELTKKEAEKNAAVIEDVGKAQRRLAELKQKIRGLGTVNVSAIEEYKEVSERYEFMSVQIGDVEKSKSELLHLINDLTKQMREIFIDRFNLINKNFSETFVELFGGGKALLSLSDPENVLTTGVDISVEPPGKIVSHIELLSGGEKALVAIALYFAIMKVSPAPFCVMDEIEAALDDVNVYRFAEYLRRMNDKTQFICITHRRGTMEEADVLYGVTMQDRGISKLLELKASEIEQKLGMKA
ncbi:MAG: chromosome segregation protein SMC [Clostridia bacterium]|nr:chromosome segregation protein SMC [Clostridia bacterium]